MYKSKDPLVETMERVDATAPLSTEKGQLSLSKLANMLITKYNIVRYMGLFWSKEGYELSQVTPDKLTVMAIHEVSLCGLEEQWSSRSLATLESFLVGRAPNKIKTPPPHWMFTKNAVVDLKTGKQITPDEDTAVIHPMPINFDPNATCPVLLEGFKRAFSPEQQEAYLSIFGARLTRLKLVTHVILSGEGGQSKGTWKDLILKIFGKRVSQDKVENIKSAFRAKSFLGCDIIWNSETDGTKKVATLIKEVTGGTSITIEAKGKDIYDSAEYQAMFCEDTNKPAIVGYSNAQIRRMQWFPMEKTFVKAEEYEKVKGDSRYLLMDPTFETRAFTDKELSGFLNLLIPYAQWYIEHGDYKVPASKDIRKLSEIADSCQTFLDNFVSRGRGQFINTQVIQKHYEEYCREIGSEAQVGYVFRKALKDMGATPSDRAKYLEGLKFDNKKFKYFIAFKSMPPEEQQEV